MCVLVRCGFSRPRVKGVCLDRSTLGVVLSVALSLLPGTGRSPICSVDRACTVLAALGPSAAAAFLPFPPALCRSDGRGKDHLLLTRLDRPTAFGGEVPPTRARQPCGQPRAMRPPGGDSIHYGMYHTTPVCQYHGQIFFSLGKPVVTSSHRPRETASISNRTCYLTAV